MKIDEFITKYSRTRFQSSKEKGVPAIPKNPPDGLVPPVINDDYLISDHHVVKDAARVQLVMGAGTIPAKVVQVDEADDIALLKSHRNFPSPPIAAGRRAALGDTVATTGFPDPQLQGFSTKLAKGIIAGLMGVGDDARYFQISVPVLPGNSGGVLVDEKGNAVGIVWAKLDEATALAASGALPENVNYAPSPHPSPIRWERVSVRTGEGAFWNPCRAWKPS